MNTAPTVNTPTPNKVVSKGRRTFRRRRVDEGEAGMKAYGAAGMLPPVEKLVLPV